MVTTRRLTVRHTPYCFHEKYKINTTGSADFQRTNKENIFQNLPFGSNKWLYKSSAIFKRVI